MNDIFWIFFIFGGLMLYVLLLLIYDWIKEEQHYQKKIKEYRAIYEKLKEEGYKPDDELEKLLK
jgi:hypothetical protein